MNTIVETLRIIWKDSVWSKVIATLFITVGGYIYYYINSNWYKLGYVLIILIAVFLYVMHIYFKMKADNAISIVLVDLNKPGLNEIETEPARSWDDVGKREYGNNGEGNYKVEKGILSIERSNTEGRYIIRFLSYTVNGKKQLFVENQDHSTTFIRLYVTFEAKVINGAHTFRVICKDFQKNVWLHGASALTFRITNTEYQKHRREIIVPVGSVFRIQIDDILNENVNSSIQIKDFKVVKLTN